MEKKINIEFLEIIIEREILVDGFNFRLDIGEELVKWKIDVKKLFIR